MSPQHIGHDQAVTRPILSDTGGSLAYRWCRSVEWKPSPVIALATSVDDARVAAAREDGSIEIWLVSPGSVGWHCQLTMQGDAGKRVSSLVWSAPGSKKDAPSGRLFSSSVDGSISEWDLYNLKVKTALESIGVSIWQMALQPQNKESVNHENGSLSNGNGVVIDRYSDASESSSSDDETDSAEIDERCLDTNSLLAVACDDGSVRLYKISDADELIYSKSLPRVGGRTLSVAWSPDGRMIYSGSSDGLIRCWDMKWGRELYRITVGLGGLGSGPELCVWSLLALRSGDLVSADSTGTVQFWDAEHGTLLQAHSLHKGDVNALAADPSHNRVFSGGSDGQVILYSLSSSSGESNNAASSSAGVMKKWRYIGYHRPHTHDVRALTVAVPISQEDSLPEVKVKRSRQQKKPKGSNYLKWAHVGVPMLISGGDDTKLFAYSAKEYTKFSAHDFCPAPQRLPVHVVPKSVFNQMPLLLVQSASSVEILTLREKDTALGEKESGSILAHPVVRVNKGSEKIICSSISPSGSWFAFSNHVKPSLFQLKRCESTNKWSIQRMKLPSILPYAHSMIFTSDSSRLIVAGHDKRIYVIDADNLKLLHIFTPRRKVEDEDVPPSEPPMTKMFVSSDGQWLAVANCFGDIYIFNLEVQRQHWFITRLDGASVTAGGFHPHHSNVLVITTSTNQLYEFDVEAKQLGEWSRKNSLHLPAEFLEFPGEIIGLSFSPSTGGSSSLVIYSSRAMCSINFALPVSHGGGAYKLSNGLDAISKKLIKSPINGKLKRKLQEHDLGHQSLHERNFKFKDFNDPVLFAGHLSRSSMLVLYRPWLDVVKNFDVQPVHRHIYGT